MTKYINVDECHCFADVFFLSPDLVIILRNVDWFSNTASIHLGSSGGFLHEGLFTYVQMA